MNKLNILIDCKYKFKFKKDFLNLLNIFHEKLSFSKFIEVDVVITDNQKIKTISNQYRGINKETDVLSFPFSFNKSLIKKIDIIHLGEIILSHKKIKQQAKEFNHTIRREFCFLFTHGLVHLYGKDHKTSLKEEKIFNDIVYNIINTANIQRN